MCLLFSSLIRLSFASVVFDFNDSLNDVTPILPILQSVDEKRKSELFMYVFCVCFFFVFTSKTEPCEGCV